MLDDCRHFLCPNDIAKDEVAKEHTIEQSLQENERERKRLILDLEKAGVNFPVTELETMASKRLIGEHVRLAGDPEDLPEQKVVKGHLAQEDYATNMPDDLKELLRRYYQLEAERESLRQGGTETAPNSVFGDEENQTESLAKVETPRAPFWFFRRRSVAIVENETNRFYETQERSGRSRHVWVPSKDGDDASHSSSRVTVIYPKEHTRKIRLGLFVCCLILLGLIAVIAFYANQHNEKDSNTTKALPLAAESATKSPADKFSPSTTADSCMDEIDLTKGCFVRGEPVGAQFKNCNPCTYKH